MRSALVASLLLAAPLRAEIVDRVVAVVGDTVITWSAAIAEANYQAFRSGQEPVNTLNEGALGKMVSHLTDQELLEKERANSDFALSNDSHAQNELDSIRKQFTPDGYAQALVRYHLTEAQLLRRISRQNGILAFIDYHLRPQVRVTAAMIETYYGDTLIPELRRKGQTDIPPMAQVSAQIEAVLAQQEMNRLLDEWLQQLRSRASIRVVSGPRP